MIDLLELKNGMTIKETIVIFSIYAQPNARKTEFEKIHDDQIKIRVQAIPEDGKANKEIIGYFSTFFNLPKKQIEIISGLTHRKKKIQIDFRKEISFQQISDYFRRSQK